MRLPIALALVAATGCSTASGGELRERRSAAEDERVEVLPADASSPAPDRCLAAACWAIERCDESSGACVPACPDGEVYIPATGVGGFVMGRGYTMNGSVHRVGKGHARDSDRPHRVVLTRPFCMDEAEVTVAAMKECVDARACRAPKIAEIRANYPKRRDHPVNEVAWRKAKEYCAWRGEDLPTEAQWEWAATGGDGRRWPWGDEPPTCERADFVIGLLVSPGGNSGCDGGGTSPVKSHPLGGKEWPAGTLYDLAGNVWEWCEDTLAPYPAEMVTDPCVRDPATIVRVVRGGGWNRSVLGIETTFRGGAIESYEVPGLGFRCVRNPGR